MFIYCSLSLQIAGRGDSHVNFEGFRKIYDSIMTVKEVSADDLSFDVLCVSNFCCVLRMFFGLVVFLAVSSTVF